MDDSSVDQHCLIDIPGKSLARISTQAQADFFLELVYLEFNCTRIDIKADDYSKTITPFLAMRASQAGNKTGFRRFSYHQDDRGAGTFYAGLRGRNGGGKFIRIYDKHIESDGEIDAVRIELEASSTKAVDIFCDLTTVSISHWPNLIRGIFKAALSFKDRQQQKKACRAPMLSWWGWFVDGSVVFSFSSVVKECVFEKTKRWMRNQVVASLAMLVCGETGDFFLRDSTQMWATIYPLIIEGLDHMGERHRNSVKQYWRDNNRNHMGDLLSPC
ncbi:MAG: replication initiation factor domain-containing protein [Cyanobacteria bacterium J06554_1]